MIVQKYGLNLYHIKKIKIFDGANRIYYVIFGAKCLWKRTTGGILGMIKGGAQYHPLSGLGI